MSHHFKSRIVAGSGPAEENKEVLQQELSFVIMFFSAVEEERKLVLDLW